MPNIYMAEATVKAARLASKSPEELRKMGIGKSEHGFYLLAAVNLAMPSNKLTALSRALVNVAKAVSDVVEAKIGTRASAATIEKRDRICSSCYEVDSAGKRLFRFYDLERVSCGQPMDPTAAGAKVLRNPILDGCGCWLREKWVSSEQSCPRDKWGPETPPSAGQRVVVKRRCCGRR